MRLGPGPVFVYEGLTAARRWQTYAGRSLFVAVILAGLTLTWHLLTSEFAPDELVSMREMAGFGESIYSIMALTELTLVLLAAPAVTAGAICLDKARGTLDHMLITDLSNAEIVLGKLGIRLVPVLGLIAATVPVLSMAGLLGGIDPAAIAGLLLVASGCAFVGCSLAMLLSVHGRKTHEVVAMTYMLLILWLISPVLVEVVFELSSSSATIAGTPMEEWFVRSNPYLLAFPGSSSSAWSVVQTDLAFMGGALAASAAMAAMATMRVRRVASRQAGGRRPSRLPRWRPAWLARRAWRLPGPSLDRNPVAWREWHRTRPTWMMRIAWGLYSALGVGGVYLDVFSEVWKGPNRGWLIVATAFQWTVGLLLLSVAAATSLAEERARGELDLLLSTPISARDILVGKWWGGFRRVFLVVFWPMAITTGAILEGGSGSGSAWLTMLALLLAHGGAITSLGLASATWVARPGRAVALCVAISIVLVIGWPILELLVVSGRSVDQVSEFEVYVTLMGDPPLGAGLLAMAAAAPDLRIGGGGVFADLIGGGIVWAGVYATIAVLLNRATHRAFDARLGRASGNRPSPPLGRLARPMSSADG